MSAAKTVTKKAKNVASKKVKSRPLTIPQKLASPFVLMYRRLLYKREVAPHKSFVRSRRRDKLPLPKVEGYISFTWYTLRMLWNRKWVYVRLLTLFVLLSFAAVGAAQVTNTSTLQQVVSDVSKGIDVIGPVTKAAATIGSALGGALNANLSDIQYLFVSALAIASLLTVVWLLRQQLAGNKVILRDGLYASLAPLAAEYVLVLIGVLQLIPFALATLVYFVAVNLGLLTGGIDTAMFSIALFLVAVLTIYFMTTTLFAMFVATIPATYPMKAYRAARQLVAGQRSRLVLRLAWLCLVILLGWFVVLMPVVIIANSFGVGSAVIPVAFQIVVGASYIYGTAYMYLLYRRMIDDPVIEK